MQLAKRLTRPRRLDAAEPELDRTVELGYLVDCLGGTCGPHLAVLSETAQVLDELHDAGGDSALDNSPLTDGVGAPRIRGTHGMGEGYGS